jgi:hypothetical protein
MVGTYIEIDFIRSYMIRPPKLVYPIYFSLASKYHLII